jgi:hypothetical protein
MSVYVGDFESNRPPDLVVGQQPPLHPSVNCARGDVETSRGLLFIDEFVRPWRVISRAFAGPIEGKWCIHVITRVSQICFYVRFACRNSENEV